ncbi:TPA: APH(6) family putative aminoglycoside O-phosphotransferase [Raoultella ornithinolytica]|uniref:aminoglycoside phosphotransferase family protein n=1 Tax=Raoultella ornithinolytica TaxID=54291 RepID=UPI000CF344B2|nr:aminoglycoside phosphotransferase family protein [Raoultella ornithinolytica]MCW9579089.1 APH(6) family putative aminoglycoside O-phosphotransferase [Raoultella ornithinolytica]PQH28197.1 APH(6) family putative aminoglycoside O-phosphotransferase [Raoultella ornithinolytica]HBZ9026340.1 APH(6) family putative aminoglycoside O-phosphotransferase [Raoultella ornithinolytica]HCA0181957.1 APH(6) family putative aminoglycoside O-phosphotransferase [Raoultella ornithinolytica]HCA0805534.1 APH(6) 
MDTDKLSFWLNRWSLIPDGEIFITHTSTLLPVKTATHGIKAMLKVTDDADEQTGNALMAWWEGNGAAQVMAYEKEAILLARATGIASLSTMSKNGQDKEACRILCATANRLHSKSDKPWPQLTPLHRWFSSLEPAALEHGGILAHCAEIAQQLLSSAQDVVVLHGDLHHDNVLDFASSGWLAIDPKGLLGERGFDFANIFTNPDLGHPEHYVARVPSIFKQRLAIVTEIAGINRERLLQWIIAWCGLSAIWSLECNDRISIQVEIAELAIAELGG